MSDHLPELDISQHPYARQERCLDRGRLVTKLLVTTEPFINFALSTPVLNHFRSSYPNRDYGSRNSYKVMWSALANAAIASGVDLLGKPSIGNQDHYDIYEGPNAHNQRIIKMKKGIEVISFPEIQKETGSRDTLAELMPTYPRTVLGDVLQFINIVVNDLGVSSEAWAYSVDHQAE